MGWQPIVPANDPLSATVWESVMAVAKDIEGKTYLPLENKQRHCAEALLFMYLAEGLGDDRWWELASERLNFAIESATHNYLGLYGGLSGVGWMIEHGCHLSDAAGDNDVSEDNNAREDNGISGQIDNLIVSRLRNDPWTDSYDLITGLVGIGVYFLERLPDAVAAEGIQLVLDKLEAVSQSIEPGLAWHTRSSLLPEWQRERCPGGYYNLGVAHGIPGVLFLLSEISVCGVGQTRAINLLEPAMNWFMAQQLPTSAGSRFSSWIPAPVEVAESPRLAWCYGDLGILSIVMQIAYRTHRTDWAKFARVLLDSCLARPNPMAGITDAPLCHGALGNAHLYNRLYQLSGDERCREASLRFLTEGLAMRQPGGIGGFFTVTRPNPKADSVFESTTAFLDGATGVALGLLASVTRLEPQWDRLLLLSGRSYSHTR